MAIPDTETNFVRALWAARILFVMGDQGRSYRARLTAFEELCASEPFKDANRLPAARLTRAAKALGIGDRQNAIRFTEPNGLGYFRDSGAYLRALMYRDDGFLDKMRLELDSLTHCSNKRTFSTVAPSLYAKLLADYQHENASIYLDPQLCSKSLNQVEANSHLESLILSIQNYKKALRDWDPNLVTLSKPWLEALNPFPTLKLSDSQQIDVLSQSFSAMLGYHLSLAHFRLGNLDDAVSEITKSLKIIRAFRKMSDGQSPTPYFEAIVQRDLIVFQFLIKLGAKKSQSKRCLSLNGCLASRSRDLQRECIDQLRATLPDCLPIVAEAVSLYNLESDLAPVISSKVSLCQDLDHLASKPDWRIRERDIRILAWVPSPRHAGTLFDPRSADLLASLGIPGDKYSNVGEDLKKFAKFPSSFTDDTSKWAVALPRTVLSVLRGWGSTIPVLSDVLPLGKNGVEDPLSGTARGGGYVISVGGTSLVVDPGYDFVTNLIAERFDLNCISHVIVSHDHPDHNADMQRLDDMRYEFQQRMNQNDVESYLRRQDHPRSRQGTLHKQYTLMCDQDTGRWISQKFAGLVDTLAQQDSRGVVDTSSLQCREIVTLSRGKLQRLNGTSVFDSLKLHGRNGISYENIGFSSKSVSDQILCSDDVHTQQYWNLNLKWWPVVHSKDVPSALGMAFCLSGGNGKSIKLGYSGDCKYLPDYIQPSALGDSDVLLLHISQPSIDELFSEGATHHETHLGFYGVLKLIEAIRPKLVILGEFWGGKGDLRRRICGEIQSRANASASSKEEFVCVLPASEGLHVDITSSEVLCSRCSSENWVHSSRIQLVRTRGQFTKFLYLCDECSKKYGMAVARK